MKKLLLSLITALFITTPSLQSNSQLNFLQQACVVTTCVGGLITLPLIYTLIQEKLEWGTDDSPETRLAFLISGLTGATIMLPASLIFMVETLAKQ